jgi:hypothetical protein
MEQAEARKNLNQEIVLERLFIGFIEEMTGVGTLDSYRAKSASACSVIVELYQVLNDWKDKKIKSPDTVLVIRDEAVMLIEEDKYLKFGKISKEYFLESLKALRSEANSIAIGTILAVEYNLYYVIVLNSDYNQSLINGIEKLFSRPYYEIEEFIEAQRLLNKLCSSLVSELLNNGYSKGFVRIFVRNEFSKVNSGNFFEKWDSFKKRFSVKAEKDYIVIFKVFITLKGVLDNDFGQILTNIEQIKHDFNLVGEEYSSFFSKTPFESFVCLDAKALDRFQAVARARKQLSTILDVVRLIYPYDTQSINNQSIVVDRSEVEPIAHMARSNAQSDGPKPNPNSYTKLITKLANIRKNDAVATDVSDKLYACIKHLRLSMESEDLEQKFLSCWIGLENIFANYITETSTFGRVKEHLVNAHLVTYLKRNLHNFHRTISSSSIRKQLASYNNDLSYLLIPESYDEMIKLEDYYPVIAYRARYLKSILFNGKRRLKYIEKHKTNLERHLVRMYRIRNEIVHDAKSSYSLENICSNLVYYLTFILSKCIEFFYDCKQKPILSHKVGLDDFFYYQKSINASLKKGEYSLLECMATPHSVELFT